MNNYLILEVPYGSSIEVIKKSYRTLAKIHHPDKGGDQSMFVKIQTAYEELLKGITGDQPRQQTYQNNNSVGSMSVVSTKLTKEGNALFEFKLTNVKHIIFNGGYYPIESNSRTGYIKVTKEELKKVKYNVKMRFVAKDGRVLDKEWNVKKPLTKWQKLKKALTPSFFK